MKFLEKCCRHVKMKKMEQMDYHEVLDLVEAHPALAKVMKSNAFQLAEEMVMASSCFFCKPESMMNPCTRRIFTLMTGS